VRKRRPSSSRAYLVRRRNQVQQLLLHLHSVRPSERVARTKHNDWQLSLGVAFSLWRAVFLMVPQTGRREIATAQTAAVKFLERVIDTNAIGFGDEYRRGLWTSGYYLNNATLRLKALTGDNIRVIDRSAGEVWDDCYKNLARHLKYVCSTD